MDGLKTEHYKFFAHKECEFFPCHKTDHEETFNCLFCYCPLYALGRECGGRFRYTENGIKDCTECLVPHSTGAYDHVFLGALAVHGLCLLLLGYMVVFRKRKNVP